MRFINCPTYITLHSLLTLTSSAGDDTTSKHCREFTGSIRISWSTVSKSNKRTKSDSQKWSTISTYFQVINFLYKSNIQRQSLAPHILHEERVTTICCAAVVPWVGLAWWSSSLNALSRPSLFKCLRRFVSSMYSVPATSTPPHWRESSAVEASSCVPTERRLRRTQWLDVMMFAKCNAFV